MKKFDGSPLRKCPRWMITAPGAVLAEHGYRDQDNDNSLDHYVYSEGFLDGSIGHLYLNDRDGRYLNVLDLDSDTNYFISERLTVPIEQFTPEYVGAGILFVMDSRGKNFDSAGRRTNANFGVIVPEKIYTPLSKLVEVDHGKVVDLMLGIFPKDLVNIMGIKVKTKMQFKDCVNRVTVQRLK